MSESFEFSSSPNPNDSRQRIVREYLSQAAAAEASGSAGLALHLYLAAYEQARTRTGSPMEDGVHALRQAWRLACAEKERSLAEYVFERLQPHLTHGEIVECGDMLQSLALDKLEEIGLSRDDLTEMADMVSRDLTDRGFVNPRIQIQHVSTPIRLPRQTQEDEVEEDAHGAAAPGLALPDAAYPDDRLTYAELRGYANAIKQARKLGIGREKDPAYQELTAQLNAYHGLRQSPGPDSLLVRAPIREDALRFLDATIGELDLAGVHMAIEDNAQGIPMLCITSDKNSRLKYNQRTGEFSGHGVMVLEDLDLWDIPPMESGEGIGGFIMSQLSRGAREAINMIHTAVLDPNVFVMATASSEAEIEPLFLDLLAPIAHLDLEMPTPGERADIWLDIAHRHPSIRGIDRAALVRFTANMARYDIYAAAREAIEETYRLGLETGRYLAVKPACMFEKIAAYQPLDSVEYQAIEDAVVSSYAREFEAIDDFFEDEAF